MAVCARACRCLPLSLSLSVSQVVRVLEFLTSSCTLSPTTHPPPAAAAHAPPPPLPPRAPHRAPSPPRKPQRAAAAAHSAARTPLDASSPVACPRVRVVCKHLRLSPALRGGVGGERVPARESGPSSSCGLVLQPRSDPALRAYAERRTHARTDRPSPAVHRAQAMQQSPRITSIHPSTGIGNRTPRTRCPAR
ncbi:hypothetical protein HYPSUDRAFT_219640 [Hypholoma sublateritium FD-334 SS-4]|uniref:Uncharacterized protein n=1 Tax=Hypholoma sublateritium (strain FD-334 SS-4) TaxID=945553 RepID=A0A0D2KNG5_HYPSF|nr:hypothetical protein HYPSUDRAFT_219640 [Hypholoma sublateritium FD-334 SS-4]